MISLVFLFTVFIGRSALGGFVPKQFAEIKVDNPAFCRIVNNDLYVTAFSGSFFAKDAVHTIRTLSAKNSYQSLMLTNKYVWPNNMVSVPPGTFDIDAITVGYGFLLPNKKNGGVLILGTSKPGMAYDIGPTEKGWSYHKVVMRDMDGDGDLDALTARFNKPLLIGNTKCEMIWLENPGGKTAYTQRWKMHKIIDGPGVHFVNEKMRGGNRDYDVIVTSQYWNKKVSLVWNEASVQGRWDKGDAVHERVIDNTLGDAFDIEYVDLNNDGKKDILVTYNAAKNGTAYAYELIGNDFRTASIRRHVLATGYNQIKSSWMPGVGSPGSAKAFRPHVSMKNRKPWVMVSGDDDGRIYILKPNSEDPSDWRYTQTYFVNEGETVGEMAIGDVDNNGFTDVFVPSHGKKRILAFKFAKE